MSIQDALDNAGVQINHRNMPEKSPTKDAFARVIDALRKAEGQAERKVQDLQDELRRAHDENKSLIVQMQKMNADIMKLRFSQRLDECPNLTVNDKQNLLEVVS